MNYLTVLLGLVVLAVVLAIGIIIALVVGSRKQKAYDLEEEYDDDDEDDIDEDDYEDSRSSSDNRGREEYVRRVPAAPAKKQWKVVLENLDTWEKGSIIFYDNIGIGRKRDESEFEKYYVVKDDPRVSKLHCAIISNGGKLYLKDMGSSNGTYLNGQKINQPIVIQKEDIIGVGETQIEIKKVLKEK